MQGATPEFKQQLKNAFDTITCTVTIQDKNEEKRLLFATATFVNQHGAEVLQSQFSGFPSHIRLAR